MLILECPITYCNAFGVIPMFAIREQNVCLSECGEICGKLAVCFLLYFFAVGAGFDCCTADGLCCCHSACCLDGFGAVLTGAVLNGVLKSSHPSVSKE